VRDLLFFARSGPNVSELEQGQQDDEGAGSVKLKVVAIVVVLVVIGIIAMALLADQAEPLPFEYEGF
jgi:hypothetical protein